jgi:hypothetical protein
VLLSEETHVPSSGRQDWFRCGYSRNASSAKRQKTLIDQECISMRQGSRGSPETHNICIVKNYHSLFGAVFTYETSLEKDQSKEAVAIYYNKKS